MPGLHARFAVDNGPPLFSGCVFSLRLLKKLKFKAVINLIQQVQWDLKLVGSYHEKIQKWWWTNIFKCMERFKKLMAVQHGNNKEENDFSTVVFPLIKFYWMYAS